MVKQVIISQCGVRFDETALSRADIDVSPIALAGPTQPWGRKPDASAVAAPSTPPTPPGENGSGEDVIPGGKGKGVEPLIGPEGQDMLTDIHDQLKLKPVWWLLEFLPMKFTWQEADGSWKSKWGINFGRGRTIRGDHPNFHESVRQRMAIPDLKYKPKATWNPGTEQYVE